MQQPELTSGVIDVDVIKGQTCMVQAAKAPGYIKYFWKLPPWHIRIHLHMKLGLSFSMMGAKGMAAQSCSCLEA